MLSALPSLSICHWRAHLRATESLRFPPPTPTGTLRGAFGTHLRLALCPTPDAECAQCLFAADCDYPPLFKGHFADRTRAERHADPPVPVLVRPADPTLRELDRGQRFTVDLLLFGAAQRYAALSLATLRRLALSGLGPLDRRVAFDLHALHALDAQLSPHADAFACQPYALAAVERVEDDDLRAVRVHFETPLFLRINSALVTRPSPADLVVSAVRRVRDLVAAYGDDSPIAERNTLAAHADGLRARDEDLRVHRAQRTSSRTHETHPLEGVVGSLVIEGALGPVMPWLRAVERVQLGRKTAFGLGRIRLEPLR